MIELTHRVTGHRIRTDEESADFWKAAGYLGKGGARAPKSVYSDLKVDELKAEIAKRNDGRDEDALLSDEGKKADLIAALEADDSK